MPSVKRSLIEILSESIQVKNLRHLELRHMDINNDNLIQLSQNKNLNRIQVLDLEENPKVNLHLLEEEEQFEPEIFRQIHQLLVSEIRSIKC